jgi:hypothetical protein
MSASKKIRFEIFKRDGFKCAYCGKSPPAVVLEVDHIEPKAKGGKDDINNYITACFDCNRGKRDIPLEKIPSQIQENLDVIREKESQLKEYRRFIAKIEKRLTNDFEEINDIYSKHYPEWEFSDQFKNVSLRRFLQLLPKHRVIEALNIAMIKWPNNKDRVIPYFCGICWNMIRGTER